MNQGCESLEEPLEEPLDRKNSMCKGPEDTARSSQASPEPWIQAPTMEDPGFSAVKDLVPVTFSRCYSSPFLLGPCE